MAEEWFTKPGFGERFVGFPLSGPVRDTPPYRAIPCRDSIAEGGIAPICLVFIGYRTGIAEIPLGSGLRAGFWEGDEDSNFSVFGVRRFSEWPEPLH